MRKKICGIIMFISVFMVAGVLGGMEVGNLTCGEGFFGAAFWLFVFFVAGRVGNIIG